MARTTGGRTGTDAYVILRITIIKEVLVAARCMVTGATPGFGNRISHSHRRTKRRFNPNIQRKRYWVPSLGRTVTLTVSAKGIKTIDRRGIDAVVRELISRGERI